MPAPNYTDEEKAVHELGHAAVACALGMGINEVRLRPPAPANPQCLLIDACNKLHDVFVDAFGLGGPLVQLVMIPASLGPHLATFQPSLFTNTPQLLSGNPAVLNELAWADLAQTHMLQMAPNSPHLGAWTWRGVKPKPWLLQLETLIRDFAAVPEVQAFVNAQKVLLVQHSTLAGDGVLAAFKAGVAPEKYKALRDYTVAQSV